MTQIKKFPFKFSTPLFIYEKISNMIFKISISSFKQNNDYNTVNFEIISNLTLEGVPGQEKRYVFRYDESSKTFFADAGDLGIPGYAYDNRPCYLDENLESLQKRIPKIQDYIKFNYEDRYKNGQNPYEPIFIKYPSNILPLLHDVPEIVSEEEYFTPGS